MEKKPHRDILKFDTNAKGFKRAAFFLVFCAFCTLAAGAYFLYSFLGG